jgi:hypothetical protein
MSMAVDKLKKNQLELMALPFLAAVPIPLRKAVLDPKFHGVFLKLL